MKVTAVASPLDIAPSGTPEATRTAKAIAAFKNGASSYDKPAPPAPTTGQLQETAVANPNSISAEELSAIKPHQTSETPDNSTPIEAAVTETPPAAEEKPKASQEWSRLARQEKQLRLKAQQQDAAFKQREAALLARESEAAQKSELNQKGFVSMDRLKADPMGVLSEAGVPYDQIAEQLINPSKIDPRLQATIDSLKSEIASLRKSSEEGNERSTRQQQEQYKAAVKQIETDVRNLVNTDPNFETVKQTGSVRDVVELIEETFKKDGYVLSVEDAANEVENYLIDEAMKLTKIEKIKRKLTQPTANGAQANKQTPISNQGQQTQSQGNSQPQMKTLTNAASSTRKLSAKERAILAFKGELK